MNNALDELQHELEAGRREIDDLRAKFERQAREHQAALDELEKNRSALLFMLEEVEAVRKKIEQAHREWIAALDGVKEPIFVHDREFRILRANRAYAERAGMPVQEVVGKHYWEVFPKGEVPHQCFSLLQEAVRGDLTRDSSQDEIVLPEGEVLICHNSVVRNEQGEYLFSVHVMEDITERKRMEQALRESEEKFRSISASAQDAIIMMGPDRRVVFWNAAAEKMFGYRCEEAMGQEVHRLISPSIWHDIFEETLPHFLSTGKGHLVGKVIELRALKKGGEEFPVELAVSSVQLGGQWHAIGIVRDVTVRKRAETSLLHLNRALRTLSGCNRTLVYAQDESDLLRRMCQVIVDSGGYRLAWVGYVWQDEAKTIKPMEVYGEGKEYVAGLTLTWDEAPQGCGPTGTAVRTGQTQVMCDFAHDARLAPWRDAALKYGYAAGISLPLRENGIVFGALSVYAAEVGAFDADEVKLLEEMAADLAFGIRTLRMRSERDRALEERQHYFNRLRESLEDSLQAIATTLEMRDPYTAGHQRRVAQLAGAIAQEMGLPEEQIHGLHLAGIVHDLGKIRIPAEVLTKPARLSEIEFNFIKTHPQAGYDILKGIEFPWPIAQIVLQHHERIDGSGYPQGLRGDAILIEARILMVADVVEAMASHRPYRAGLGVEAALEEIIRNRGVFYDAQVVDACLRLFREKNYTLPN